MGWGNTLKIVVKYRGKVLKSVEEIQQEQKKLEEEYANHWETIKQMVYTSPIDYVSQFGEECWRTYDKTIKTLTLRFNYAKKAIIDTQMRLMQLYLLEETQKELDKNKKKKNVEIGMYGCTKWTKWYFDLTEKFGESRDFGTIGTCFSYFSKPRIALTSEYAIEEYFDDTKSYVDLWFNHLMILALANIKDMCYVDDCPDEEENACHHNLESAMQKFNDYKEEIEEDLPLMCRLQLALNSLESVNQYMQYIDELEKKEDEWKCKSDEIMQQAYDELKIDRDQMFRQPNYNELSELLNEKYKELMLQQGVPLQCPVNWEEELYEE